MNLNAGTILVNADDYYDLNHKLFEAEKTIADLQCDLKKAHMNDSKEVMTVFDKIKSLTPREFAKQYWVDCPFSKCDKNMLNMSKSDATCVNCIHIWLLSEYKESE